MAKCGCSGQACSCVLEAGANVEITGTGTVTNPFRITARPMNMQVVDTATINLTMTGDGSLTTPFTLSAAYIGVVEPPDWTPSEARNWSGAVSIADVTMPRTLRITMTGNVTAVTLPSWGSGNSGSISLMISQDATGGRTWVMPGTSAYNIDVALSTAPLARDLIVLHWTGVQWVVLPSAMNVA